MLPQKILIVEDDCELGRAVAIRLKANGYETTLAQDAYQGVKFALDQKPDLIIMDICMPAGSGFRVHETVNESSGAFIPVVYMSGAGSEREKARARELGAAGFLQKPVFPEEVLEVVQRCLGASAAQDSPVLL